jgi:gas vesicle protein
MVMSFGLGFFVCEQYHKNKPTGSPKTTRLQAYSSLYQLAKDESQVDGILIIKSPSKQTAELLKDVSKTYSDLIKQLEEWKNDKQISLDSEFLTRSEKLSREKMESVKANKIIFNNGHTFEVYILSSQSDALLYTQTLLEVLISEETNEKRKDRLEHFHKKIEKLGKRCSKLFARDED